MCARPGVLCGLVGDLDQVDGNRELVHDRLRPCPAATAQARCLTQAGSSPAKFRHRVAAIIYAQVIAGAVVQVMQ